MRIRLLDANIDDWSLNYCAPIPRIRWHMSTSSPTTRLYHYSALSDRCQRIKVVRRFVDFSGFLLTNLPSHCSISSSEKILCFIILTEKYSSLFQQYTFFSVMKWFKHLRVCPPTLFLLNKMAGVFWKVSYNSICLTWYTWYASIIDRHKYENSKSWILKDGLVMVVRWHIMNPSNQLMHSSHAPAPAE